MVGIYFMAWVYILRSNRDGRFYIGSTTDIKSRLKHHAGGFTHSTRRFGGSRCVFLQEYEMLREARAIEQRLKKLKRKDYIENIVKEGKINMRP